MTTRSPGRIRELADTDQTIADPQADVRGRTVVDRGGEEIGRVDDLLIDEQAKHVLFLRVAEGGFLGFGASHYLVPVEAVVAVHADRVEIDQWRGGMGDVPAYDPELAPVPAYYGNVYGWWGVAPYWGAYPR
ncbi:MULTISPECIES: PRC-barrel domain-containing protein [unclassified Blastococcus]